MDTSSTKCELRFRFSFRLIMTRNLFSREWSPRGEKRNSTLIADKYWSGPSLCLPLNLFDVIKETRSRFWGIPHYAKHLFIFVFSALFPHELYYPSPSTGSYSTSSVESKSHSSVIPPTRSPTISQLEKEKRKKEKLTGEFPATSNSSASPSGWFLLLE